MCCDGLQTGVKLSFQGACTSPQVCFPAEPPGMASNIRTMGILSSNKEVVKATGRSLANCQWQVPPGEFSCSNLKLKLASR
jgi:hypothetical protein